MLELKKMSCSDRRQLKSIPIKRHRIDTRSRYFCAFLSITFACFDVLHPFCSYDQKKQRNRQQLIESTKSK